ncbi:SRPBCC family protein [Amycolatopsis viridis]|uniref:Polyketide cyclase n=1 Tax=Amycolatopsis viridis TaxID=185678 RepID=A0ABX0SRA3_9PSEU|nr:SRPBCC family protein [Amycolatopsis viridis]NIH79486.1 hypothetical protein [Amycolatopsis viridis]
MWQYEQTAETTASRDAVWQCWSDVRAWPEWNPGLASIAIDGPFQPGTAFTMTALDGDDVRLRLVDVVPGELFVDEHRVQPLAGGRTRVRYRTEITGPAADAAGPELGPAITGDFPAVLAALVRRAEG